MPRTAAKIEGRRYTDVIQFRDDVRLTFNNCRIFNPPGALLCVLRMLGAAAAVAAACLHGRCVGGMPRQTRLQASAGAICFVAVVLPPALMLCIFTILPCHLPAAPLLAPSTGNHVRIMGDQACERFEKKWQMSGIEFHWNTHKRQCELEDEQLEAESKSLPDKLQAVTAELQELTRKVGGWVCAGKKARKAGWVAGAGKKQRKGGWRVLRVAGVARCSRTEAPCCAMLCLRQPRRRVFALPVPSLQTKHRTRSPVPVHHTRGVLAAGGGAQPGAGAGPGARDDV